MLAPLSGESNEPTDVHDALVFSNAVRRVGAKAPFLGVAILQAITENV